MVTMLDAHHDVDDHFAAIFVETPRLVDCDGLLIDQIHCLQNEIGALTSEARRGGVVAKGVQLIRTVEPV